MPAPLRPLIVWGVCLFATHAAAFSQTFSWAQIESEIQRHRNQVRWCGPLSAIRCLRLLGHDIDAAAILGPLQDSDPRGSSIEDVLQLCRRYEPPARVIRSKAKRWWQLDTPCILIVNHHDHALVLEDLSLVKQTARIFDPSVLKVQTLRPSQLRELWTGDAILLRPPPWPVALLAAANGAVLVLLLWRRRSIAIRRRRASGSGGDRSRSQLRPSESSRS